VIRRYALSLKQFRLSKPLSRHATSYWQSRSVPASGRSFLLLAWTPSLFDVYGFIGLHTAGMKGLMGPARGFRGGDGMPLDPPGWDGCLPNRVRKHDIHDFPAVNLIG
jgi:hypothetical protein